MAGFYSVLWGRRETKTDRKERKERMRDGSKKTEKEREREKDRQIEMVEQRARGKEGKRS